jgi:hypothetical protein
MSFWMLTPVGKIPSVPNVSGSISCCLSETPERNIGIGPSIIWTFPTEFLSVLDRLVFLLFLTVFGRFNFELWGRFCLDLRMLLGPFKIRFSIGRNLRLGTLFLRIGEFPRVLNASGIRDGGMEMSLFNWCPNLGTGIMRDLGCTLGVDFLPVKNHNTDTVYVLYYINRGHRGCDHITTDVSSNPDQGEVYNIM